MKPADAIVIIGAGHAAVQLCAELIHAGQGHRVQLVGNELELPYQRPPLSKSFLKQLGEQPLQLRDKDWFAAGGVELILGEAVCEIDRSARTVALAGGRRLSYGHLVLATGMRARAMPCWPEGLSNVHVLRSAHDARALRQALQACSAITILGGGFIGLEVAATCAALGKQVTVLEAGARLMGRAVSATLSDHVLGSHTASGMDVELQASVREPVFSQGRLARLETNAGVREVDLLLLAIGAVPNDELAQAAGLVCENGIVVDSALRTSDPDILALGDCTRFPWRQGHLRLESIQNAQDQARLAASTLLGTGAPPYMPVPWFWSEQGRLRLQMVGLLDFEPDQTLRRDASQPGAFSLFHYHGGVLRCVESVNAPADYMVARKMLEAGLSPSPQQVADIHQPLRSLLLASPAP